MILDDLAEQKIAIDAVVVSGHLTQSGQVEEFVWAKQSLETLAQGLHIPIERVIVVPGNHDIKWQKEEDKKLPEHDLSEQYRAFYELLYRDRPKDGKEVIPRCIP